MLKNPWRSNLTSRAQTQAQMTRTAEQIHQLADAAMTREWTATKIFVKRRDSVEHAQRRLRFAAAPFAHQRAWLIYDVAQRVIVGGKFIGGSMQAMMHLGCLTDLGHTRGNPFAARRWRS